MASTPRRTAISANRRAQLNLYESAVIAGLLKAPTRFSPARDRDTAAARAAQVLANMVEAGYISQSEAAAAEREAGALGAIAVAPAGRRAISPTGSPTRSRDFAGTDDRDLTVATTLDPRMQAAAESGGRRHARARRRQGRGQPGRAGRDVARRRGARHGRRPRLRRKPVQPRDPGAAPARLGVQAVRLSRRARSRAAARRPFCRRPDPDRQLAAAQLRATAIRAT